MIEMIGGLVVLCLIANVIFPLRRIGFTRWRAAGLLALVLMAIGAVEQWTMTDEDRAAIEQQRAADRLAAAKEREAKRLAEAAAEAEERRKGFHCLSGWDGSHTGVVADVKRQLNDPDSFEHDETRVTLVSAEGTHRLFMNFRAKNAFGGMVRGQAEAVYQSEGCAHTVIAIR